MSNMPRFSTAVMKKPVTSCNACGNRRNPAAPGSGKSSLARAGVAAALMQHAYDEQVKVWRVVPFFPSRGGSDLTTCLTRSLAEQLPEIRSSTTVVDDIAGGVTKIPR